MFPAFRTFVFDAAELAALGAFVGLIACVAQAVGA